MAPTFHLPGLVLTEHTIEVPLDHANPGGQRISIFAREVADPEGLDKPFLLYLQGGPGFESPRPTRHPSDPSWLDRALADYRVVLLDQRGTGRSTPVGDLAGLTAEAQATYLTHFRADEIVRDAEAVREFLEAKQWSVLGQSFGGFVALTYLSFAPDGVREAFFTGGLPPIGTPVDEIYQATYARVIDRCQRYYDRYPDDRERVLAVHRTIESGEPIRLPSGDALSTGRLRQLGHLLGGGGGAEHLHYILELDPASPGFRYAVDTSINWGRNPLYAAIHESCYADGGVTAWSAARVMPAEYAEDPAMLTGEHVFPWMFDEVSALAPLRDAAHLLAGHCWPRLYDADQLAANQVPAAAAIYPDDMYVERAFSEATAASVKGLRPWFATGHQHSALRTNGAEILDHLITLVRSRG